jgi:hypothetical protein
MRRIQPDEIHINLPTRPPAETWVQVPGKESVARAMAILGDTASVVSPAEGSFDLGGHESVADAIIAIITRHPMDEKELEHTLEELTPGRVREALLDLEASGRAQVVERFGTRFWSAAPSHYPDEIRSRATEPDCHRGASRSRKA